MEIALSAPEHYNGSESIEIIVTDGFGGQDSEIVDITINPINDIPVASDFNDNTDENSNILDGQVPPATDVDSDSDGDGIPDIDEVNPNGYSLVSPTSPLNCNNGASDCGTLNFNDDGSYTFIVGTDFDYLRADESTTVTFDYTASDNSPTPGISTPKTVTITINGEEDPTTTLDDVDTASEDGSIVYGSLPVQDLDLNDTFTYFIDQNTSEGSVSWQNSSSGIYAYDPGSDFQDLRSGVTRIVSFTYYTQNQFGDQSNTSTVTITVTGTNDNPIAENHTDSTFENSNILDGQVPPATDVDSDSDGDGIPDIDEVNPNGYSLVSPTSPLNCNNGASDCGTLNFNDDGSYTFIVGTDFDYLRADESTTVTFDYTASDNSPTPGISTPKTVTITINGEEDPTTTLDDVDTASEDGSIVYGSLPVQDLDLNDTFTYFIDQNTSEGSVSWQNSSSGIYAYDPGSDFQDLRSGVTRIVSFTYYTQNQFGDQSNTSTVTITVTGTNDNPIAENHTDSTFENSNILDGQVPPATDVDSDSDGDGIPDIDEVNPNGYSLVSPTSPLNCNNGASDCGTLNFNDDGSYTFIVGTDFDYLADGESSTVSFNYTASDLSDDPNPQTGTSNPKTVTITIVGENDSPIILINNSNMDNVIFAEDSGQTQVSFEAHENSIDMVSNTNNVIDIHFEDKDISDKHVFEWRLFNELNEQINDGQTGSLTIDDFTFIQSIPSGDYYLKLSVSDYRSLDNGYLSSVENLDNEIKIDIGKIDISMDKDYRFTTSDNSGQNLNITISDETGIARNENRYRLTYDSIDGDGMTFLDDPNDDDFLISDNSRTVLFETNPNNIQADGFVEPNYSINKIIEVNNISDLSEFNLKIELTNLDQSSVNYVYSGTEENNSYFSDESIRVGTPFISMPKHQPFVLQDTEVLINDYYYHELDPIMYFDNKGIADSLIRISIPQNRSIEWGVDYSPPSINQSDSQGSISFLGYDSKTVTFQVNANFEENDLLTIEGLYVKSQTSIPPTELSLAVNSIDDVDYILSEQTIRIGQPTINFATDSRQLFFSHLLTN